MDPTCRPGSGIPLLRSHPLARLLRRPKGDDPRRRRGAGRASQDAPGRAFPSLTLTQNVLEKLRAAEGSDPAGLTPEHDGRRMGSDPQGLTHRRAHARRGGDQGQGACARATLPASCRRHAFGHDGEGTLRRALPDFDDGFFCARGTDWGAGITFAMHDVKRRSVRLAAGSTTMRAPRK